MVLSCCGAHLVLDGRVGAGLSSWKSHPVDVLSALSDLSCVGKLCSSYASVHFLVRNYATDLSLVGSYATELFLVRMLCYFGGKQIFFVAIVPQVILAQVLSVQEAVCSVNLGCWRFRDRSGER